MVEVIVTDEFKAWYEVLDDETSDDVEMYVGLLEANAFDPQRNAVLILGGDKTGDERFYPTMISRCERIWREYLTQKREPRGRK